MKYLSVHFFTALRRTAGAVFSPLLFGRESLSYADVSNGQIAVKPAC
jgi:hypothetical protein